VKVKTQQMKDWDTQEPYPLHTIVLHDLHREYTGGWEGHEGYHSRGRHRECEIAWSTSGVQDTLQDLRDYPADRVESETERLMHEFLPPEFIEREGDMIEAVWKLNGPIEFLSFKFMQLVERLEVDSVSGDDDAFDYWPNTMDMLWDFASDLDEIAPERDGFYRQRVWKVAKKVFEGTIAAPWGPEGTNEELQAQRRDLFKSEWGLDAGHVTDWRGWSYMMGAEAT
jgi:hypothetical protein